MNRANLGAVQDGSVITSAARKAGKADKIQQAIDIYEKEQDLVDT